LFLAKIAFPHFYIYSTEKKYYIYYMGYQNLSLEEYGKLLSKANGYMPKEEKKKAKLTLKQIFILKNRKK
tara:strand:+ start:337 stop:546 length:210 start_codon:yes stop_codon:yes gene_type:complete